MQPDNKSLTHITSAERHKLSLDIASAADAVCNRVFCIVFRTPISSDNLRAGLETLIASEQALRSTFEVEDTPIREVHSRSILSYEQTSLAAISPYEQEEQLRLLADHCGRTRFQISRGPLARFWYVSFGEEVSALIIVQHQLIADPISIRLFPLLLARTQALAGTAAAIEPMWRPDTRTECELMNTEAAQSISVLKDSRGPSLPHDKAIARRTHRGRRLDVTIDESAYYEFQSVLSSSNVDLLSGLLSIYAVLLSRWSGERQFSIGVEFNNRVAGRNDQALGCFAEVLPIFIDFDDDTLSFCDLLVAVSEQVRAVRQYGVRFAVQQQLSDQQHEADPSSTLRSVMISVQEDIDYPPSVSANKWEPVFFSADGTMNGTARTDLSLILNLAKGKIDGFFEYSTDLFNDSSIVELRDRFLRVLATATTDPSAPCARLQTLSAQELSDLDQLSTGQFFDSALMSSVSERIEAYGHTRGDSIAVEDGDTQLTYRQLDEASRRLAVQLLNCGVGRESLVGIHLDRGISFLVAVLAVFKAGGAYLPIDTGYPSARIHQIVAESNINVVISDQREKRALSFEIEGVTTLWLGEENTLPTTTAFPFDRPSPRDLAYVIYTSGSSGVPKGAMIEHRGMMNHLLAKSHILGLTSSSRIAQTAPHSFDIAVWQYLVSLIDGGCTSILRAEATDPIRLLDAVEERSITILETVPSILYAALEHLAQRGHPPILQKLEYLILTGETLPIELTNRWFEAYPKIPLINAYGPTECSDDVAHHLMTRPVREGGSVPIGKPILNTKLHVVDRHMQVLPRGCVGEICVSGMAVGRGYLNNSLQTRKVFVSDIVNMDHGGLLYKTGDFGRWNTEGFLECFGRQDDQIKLRGQRIELGEIEAFLERQQEIGWAAVVVQGNGSSARLVGFVVKRAEVGEDILLRRMKDALPLYMVPSTIVFLDRIPVTANGKVDRKRLSEHFPESRMSTTDESATKTEEILAVIWSELLNIKHVSVTLSFAAAGGHSLLAAQMLLRIEAELGVTLSYLTLADNDTIRTLAMVVDKHLAHPANTKLG